MIAKLHADLDYNDGCGIYELFTLDIYRADFKYFLHSIVVGISSLCLIFRVIVFVLVFLYIFHHFRIFLFV